ILAPDHFRFVVLRDPFRRLLSAYLDKVVRTWRNQHTYLRFNLLRETIAGAQRLAGLAYDPLRSISFEEFVHYLADTDDAACNLHWLPQYRFAGRDLGIYHHVGKVERLADTHALLADRFGYRTETWPEVPRPSPRRHTARYSPDARLAAPHLALPRELDAHEDSLPEPDRFYTPTLRQMVAKRFAEDVALYDAIDSLP
ncbi:MAG TPA: sulfotransferase family 2 domain-containing protein, partial [Acetobacteraceae bacterium]|nr:sulfotransferase family 2 domain-containing protein [Acetobacteraceae bacterium]